MSTRSLRRTSSFHLPSGTTSCDAAIVLGPGAVINVKKLTKEIDDYLKDTTRLHIDHQAMIIEDGDIELEEKSLKGQIGSTAQGVGYATSRKLLRTAASPRVRLARDVPELNPYVGDTTLLLNGALQRSGRLMLEGTQGTALSLHHGQYPYVTSRDTTAAACLSEAGLPPRSVRKIVMVCRTYPIRVASPEQGTSGAMQDEVSFQVVSDRSGIPVDELVKAEKTTTTNRDRRVAEFDWNVLARSVALNGPTDIALTFVDYLGVTNREAQSFDDLTPNTHELASAIEGTTGLPVSLMSVRFSRDGVLDRRKW